MCNKLYCRKWCFCIELHLFVDVRSVLKWPHEHAHIAHWTNNRDSDKVNLLEAERWQLTNNPFSRQIRMMEIKSNAVCVWITYIIQMHRLFEFGSAEQHVYVSICRRYAFERAHLVNRCCTRTNVMNMHVCIVYKHVTYAAHSRRSAIHVLTFWPSSALWTLYAECAKWKLIIKSAFKLYFNPGIGACMQQQQGPSGRITYAYVMYRHYCQLRHEVHKRVRINLCHANMRGMHARQAYLSTDGRAY